MTRASPASAAIQPKHKVKPPFFCVGNEVFDIFLPLAGAECLAVYGFFTRRVFSNPTLKHSIREIADVTGLGTTTVSRSLEILEYLRLIKLTRFGGSQHSTCQLLDSQEAAFHFGAKYQKNTLAYSLPPEVAPRLKTELELIRRRQQGKATRTAPDDCGNLIRDVSQRNSGASPVTRQRSNGETQKGLHLLIEERRTKDNLSPTPFHVCKNEKTKDLPGDDGAFQQLNMTWARARFDGLINDMRNHLLDPTGPENGNLSNGFDDWREFGFGNLAVDSTSWSGATLLLVLSANDPAATQRGLDKYHKRWGEIVRERYECEVQVELIERSPKR